MCLLNISLSNLSLNWLPSSSRYFCFWEFSYKLKTSIFLLENSNYLHSESDDPISVEEIEKGIRKLKNNKAPGAPFSKLPVITGPVRLFCFPFQMGVS